MREKTPKSAAHTGFSLKISEKKTTIGKMFNSFQKFWVQTKIEHQSVSTNEINEITNKTSWLLSVLLEQGRI